MAYNCLSDFVARLEDVGQLHRISVAVDPLLEIAEITDRIAKTPAGGKALLFEKVQGSTFPVITNIFGSVSRICQALEVTDLNKLGALMEKLLDPCPAPAPLQGDWLPEAALSKWVPVVVTTGPCQQVASTEPDLDIFPVLKSWPEDAGRFITLPLVFTVDPESGLQNCGMYRTRIFDKATAGIHWQPGSGGAVHAEKFLLRQERMPVAVVLGCDPAVIWSATLPLPATVDEMAFAGYIRQEPVSMVKCITSSIMVPANAEMVIEGFIEPGELQDEGGFGNHTGYYSRGKEVPVVRVCCITRRENMIFPATVVGTPPMEDCYLAKAAERLLLPVTRRQFPAVVDINLPMEGIFHGCTVVAINKEGSDHPRQVMAQIWNRGWLSKARLLIIVDADVNVRDLSFVAWKIVNNMHWSRDIIIDNNRMGLDATAKTAADDRRPIEKDASITALVNGKWRLYGWE